MNEIHTEKASQFLEAFAAKIDGVVESVRGGRDVVAGLGPAVVGLAMVCDAGSTRPRPREEVGTLAVWVELTSL